MTAPSVFTQAQLDHLAACRQAWERAIHAQAYDGSHLPQLLDRVRELTGESEVNYKVSLAEFTLRDYPMPDVTDTQTRANMWKYFHMLVLAVQVRDQAWGEYLTNYLERLDTGHDAEWWLARAEAYSPLGLTIGTCV